LKKRTKKLLFTVGFGKAGAAAGKNQKFFAAFF